MMVKQAAHDFQWVNVVSDGTESSFHTPGVIRNNEYVVTISTSGKRSIIYEAFEARTNIYIA